jgi:uncharacterized membrane protein
MSPSGTPGGRWLRPFHIARRRPHFSTAAAIFVVLAATTIGAGFGLARGMLIAFDVSAAIFLAGVVRMFMRSPIATIRARVATQDAGRWGVLCSSIVVTSVAVVSLAIELGAGKSGGIFEVVLAAASLVLSWLFLNTMFGLHYAHEYYMKEKGAALAFPQGAGDPDYWDFMYFAFVLGMTFQVSDVQIVRARVRRIALVHGIIAFFFDVFILALSVNVVAGKL